MDILDDLVYSHMGVVEKYLMTALAQRIHDNVPHPEPRQLDDWVTAESYIRWNVDDDELQSLTKQFLVLSAYELLRKKEIPYLPKIEYDKMFDYIEGYSTKCKTVTDALSKLADFENGNQLLSLFQDLSHEERNRHLELILGTYARDMLQSMKHNKGHVKLMIEAGYTDF